MNFHFLNFANGKYEDQRLAAANRMHDSGLFASINSIKWDEFSKTEFYRLNQTILECERGAGYWLWKPYLILRLLTEIPEGDVVVYTDVSDKCEAAGLLAYLKSSFAKDILLVPGCFINKDWTKRDAFAYLNADSEEYWDCKQLEAGIIIAKNTLLSKMFINLWLLSCQDSRILTDDINKSGLRNFPSFKDHRHDQSALTILHQRYQSLIQIDNTVRNWITCNYYE